jgi:hypothetical protein
MAEAFGCGSLIARLWLVIVFVKRYRGGMKRKNGEKNVHAPKPVEHRTRLKKRASHKGVVVTENKSPSRSKSPSITTMLAERVAAGR